MSTIHYKIIGPLEASILNVRTLEAGGASNNAHKRRKEGGREREREGF